MHRQHAGMLTALAAGLVVLSGCGAATAAGGPNDPAHVVPGARGIGSLVVLSDAAAARIGIQTDRVRAAATPAAATPPAGYAASPNIAPLLTIPASALLYDNRGDTFVYVSPSPHSYMREPVVLAQINGATAVLKSGPAESTEVVTVGGMELLGTEFGVAGGG